MKVGIIFGFSYILCLYELYWSYILEEYMRNLEDWSHQKIARCVVANTGN